MDLRLVRSIKYTPRFRIKVSTAEYFQSIGGFSETKMRRLLLLVSTLLLAACQGAPRKVDAPQPMSVEQAKQLAAAFGAVDTSVPPRTIADITSILNSERPDDVFRSTVQARLAIPPPVSNDPKALAEYHRRRSLFDLQAGLGKEAVDDANQSVKYALEAKYKVIESLNALRVAYLFIDDRREDLADEVYRRSAGGMYSVGVLQFYVQQAIRRGDIALAKQRLEESDRTLTYMRPDEPNANGLRADNAATHAQYESAIGNLVEAEKWARKALAFSQGNLVADSAGAEVYSAAKFSLAEWQVTNRSFLVSRILISEGRLLEAEVLVREVLLNNLRRSGRSSPQTADSIGALALVLFSQGRYPEAELLRKAQLETLESMGLDTRTTRRRLADVVAMEGRFRESVDIYENSPRDTSDLKFGDYLSPARIVAHYELGEVETGLTLAKQYADGGMRPLVQIEFDAAIGAGLVAIGEAMAGRRDVASNRFRSIYPRLRGSDVELKSGQVALTHELRTYILEAHLANLVRLSSNAGSLSANILSEAFGVGDSLRIAATDMAVAASVARTQLGSSEAADLSRREQDARREIVARQELLAHALEQPAGGRDASIVSSLQGEIRQLETARTVLVGEIAKRSPGYSDLTSPMPASIDQARAILAPDEAVVAITVGRKESYVWAFRKSGVVSFSVVSMGREELSNAVSKLRRSLDPKASTLGDIPPFDVLLANQLFDRLLGSVESGWNGASSIVVAVHGPLSQIPFSLLVTKAIAQPGPGFPLFSEYASVPFLFRSVAISQVPSVAALLFLRGMAPPKAGRVPFVGFGDPLFNVPEASEAANDASIGDGTRGFRLRSEPGTSRLNTAKLSSLPQLPDTAEEVRQVAESLHSDARKDVLLGLDATEWRVRTMKLDDRKVVMFATHGLVPGDLDGLQEPALALTSPSLAGVQGDGLLTMSKVLDLRLDADWVVLSACNTASGDGKGGDAISGLGRAFFYAGARALLVTNWPVETTSARLLTTSIFQHQSANSVISRAQALRAAMIDLTDGKGAVDQKSGRVLYSFAHPIFWAPFSLVGDGR